MLGRIVGGSTEGARAGSWAEARAIRRPRRMQLHRPWSCACQTASSAIVVVALESRRVVEDAPGALVVTSLGSRSGVPPPSGLSRVFHCVISSTHPPVADKALSWAQHDLLGAAASGSVGLKNRNGARSGQILSHEELSQRLVRRRWRCVGCCACCGVVSPPLRGNSAANAVTEQAINLSVSPSASQRQVPRGGGRPFRLE